MDHQENSRPLVILVDDDESVRESLPDLLRHFGLQPEVFSSAEAFLDSKTAAGASCLLLDVGLPGLSGPALHDELRRQGYRIPTIFITANSDRSLAADLLARGAVACLFKPFDDAELLDALTAALESDDGAGGAGR